MKHLLTILTIFIAVIPLCAQQPADIGQLTERINNKCPLEISDGMVMVSATVADGQFIFYYTISDEMFSNISPLGGLLHDSLLAELESSPDPLTKSLLSLCKASDTVIVQRFTNSSGKTFDITILPSEI